MGLPGRGALVELRRLDREPARGDAIVIHLGWPVAALGIAVNYARYKRTVVELGR